jgi:hypothetical protein
MSGQLNLGDYFTFRKFISRTFIIIIYALGALAITVLGVINMMPKRIPFLDTYSRSNELQILLGIVFIIVGNLLWRILCESAIVLFSIRDDLHKIEKHLEGKK